MKQVNITTTNIGGVWEYFVKGDMDRYHQSIATAIDKHANHYDVIVLAQASMAGATAFCTQTAVPVLTSPELGVKAAVDQLSVS